MIKKMHEIITAQKAAMRREMMLRRETIDMASRICETSATMTFLFASREYQDGQNILCTMPFGSEIDTRAVIAQAKTDGKRIALPRVVDKHALQLHWFDEKTSLVPSPWGILEPAADTPTLTITEVDIILVPGLAFDLTGNRLGYGRGYYDQLLGSAQPTTSRLAIGFTCQVVTHVPVSTHDAPIHTLITANGVSHFQEHKQ